MSKDKIFRETPFNGYNRVDVMAYIAEQDQIFKSEKESLISEKERLQNDLNEKKEKIDELSSIIDSLNFAVDEKTSEYNNLKNEFEEYKLQNEQKEPEIVEVPSKEQTEMIDSLKSQVESFRSRINELENENRKQLEQICGLQAAQTSESLDYTRAVENERLLHEKEEKIKFLEKGWQQYKDNYSKITNMQDSAEKLLADARTEAEDIVNQARVEAERIKTESFKDREIALNGVNQEVQLLISNAIKESGKIITTAETKAKEINEAALLNSAQTKSKLQETANYINELINKVNQD